MKISIFLGFVLCMLFINPFGFYGNAAVILWGWYVLQLIFNSQHIIAFREFVLVLYGMNYLLSPALSYNDVEQATGLYSMKIPQEDYFVMAIPAMLCLQAGLFMIKTSIFKPNFSLPKLHSALNIYVLKVWLWVGIACLFLQSYVPGELAFFLFLISGIRYIAVFGLFIIDKNRFKWYLLLVLLLEVIVSIRSAMFHDMVMWLIFFSIFLSYFLKLKVWHKLVLGSVAVMLFFVLQVSKNEYRRATWYGTGETGIETFQDVTSKSIEEGLFTETNISGAVSRVNQAWIFASTVERMQRVRDYQGMYLVGLYLESAILPRFIAPNKISSGNKEIFNKFSGHYIRGSTSMGLGVFADGFIAYGYWGVLVFAMILGLMFGLVFKIVEGWAEISPFFIFFIFPLLLYAVRPDCETQTLIGHMVKGLIVFGVMMSFYRKSFAKKISVSKRQAAMREAKGSPGYV